MTAAKQERSKKTIAAMRAHIDTNDFKKAAKRQETFKARRAAQEDQRQAAAAEEAKLLEARQARTEREAMDKRDATPRKGRGRRRRCSQQR